jgi:prepilin-type N-terminal cleavage/methylation domain-containing protein
MPSRLPTLQRRSGSSGGFTIIEIMVVIAIIVILAAITVSVGKSVKTNAQIRSTHLTLKTLEGLMKDYLAAGNPEPDNPLATGYAANVLMSATNPASDPTRWVKALLNCDSSTSSTGAVSKGPIAKSLGNLSQGSITDPDVGANSTTVILDSWGTPIRYVPYNATTKAEGYFVSAGPDHQFSTTTPSPTPALPPDDLYSTDSQ